MERDYTQYYKRVNLIIGWSLFAISVLIYFLTLEPTASWWDPGERIACAFKLQIMHPPGAPLYQMLARMFSLLALGNLSRVAYWINAMSAVAGGLSVMFLFWTIVMLGRRLLNEAANAMGAGTWIIWGAGIVGSLTLAFSDSFWFTAVEAEVYATSFFLTAFVFWAILKWEARADEPDSLKWLVLIAFIIGLSIGVHLLNLLAIPSIAFIYYFKRYKATAKGLAATGIISVTLLYFIMNVLIPGIVLMETRFELFFVNALGLPFNVGTVIYFSLLASLIIWGLYYTHQKRKVILNTILLSLTFLMIGYSSFFMIVIRSSANPPQNMNSPSGSMTMLSYLGREQYGTWPLLYGPYFNAPHDPANPASDGSPVYRKDATTGRYVIVDDRKGTLPNYDSRFETIFPRMWSNQRQQHIDAYKSWGRVKGVPISITRMDGSREVLYKPTFRENLRFFFSYQLSHMYFRYFMWNFVGRQNNVEGHGTIQDGNWISGVNAIDKIRLGDQKNLPLNMQNPAQNRFYFLPLVLGIIGLLFQWKRNYKDTVVVALLFIMTGIAIIVYLNQTPFQPRERDYSYAASFYAFSIWIGVGVIALWNFLRKILDPKLSAVLVTVLSLLLVPGIMAKEGWNDHDRSDKYIARDFAYNYLAGCDPNAVLFTFGDNDTFPLWYIQDVEDVRTDVRVANHMLAGGDWYVHQLARKVNDSEPLAFTLTNEQYNLGANDVVAIWERGLTGHTELHELIRFVANEADHTKVSIGRRRVNYLPTRNIKMTIDREGLIANGLIPEHMANNIETEIRWEVKEHAVYRNDLMLLDFLANTSFTRPVYFTSPREILNVFSLDEYIHLEGFIYKLMPVKAKHYERGLGGIHVEATYDALMNKAKWGNINDPRVTIDRESMRNSYFPRLSFRRLALALLDENRVDSAIAVADKYIEVFPNFKFPYTHLETPFTEVYYEAALFEKGNELVRTIANNLMAEVAYYDSQRPSISAYYGEEREIAMIILQRLAMSARIYDQQEVADEINGFITLRR